MRRKMSLVALLLAVLMVMGLFAGCANNNTTTAEPTKAPAADTTGDTTDTTDDTTDDATTGDDTADVVKNANQIVMGSTTELSGDWGNAWWTNNAADADVRSMMDDLGTVSQDQYGDYLFNPSVVAEQTSVVNEDESKTYTLKINEGLKFNDGTTINAKNFVAKILLAYSPAIKDMGGKVVGDLIGFSAYQNGEVNYVSGIKLIDDYTFSLTIDPEKLPYFYDITFASITPLAIHMWLPEGFDVADDGEGAYFTKEIDDAAKAQIEKARTLSDGRVCAGPYQLDKFDAASLQATLSINPNYPGNFEGQKPSIAKVVYIKLEEETMFDLLQTGGVDVLTGLAEGAEIDKALDLEAQGGYATATYDRAGYGKIQFACDFGPTQFKEVRQAVAYLLDRNDFATTFTGGYGSVVHGPYGLAMWMYQDGEEDLIERLNTYNFSVDAAIANLEAAGFTLNADGTEYTEGIRYKEVTAEEAGDYKHNVTLADGRILMPLIIEWSSSEGNSVSELIAVKLAESEGVKQAGMQINQNVMTFTELLNYMYRDSSQGDQYAVKTYGMFNLATNFSPVYDQSYSWTLDPELVAQGYNTCFLLDEEMDRLSMEMVYGVEAGDNDTYLSLWLDYIDRWNDLLPEIPLYSNQYHDVYVDKFENYEVSSYWELASQVIYMSVVNAE